MHPIKLIWAARALVYKCTLKHIGNLTYIGKPCFIAGRKRISIGSRTRIFPGIRMEAIDTGEIKIGDNVAIEQNVHITSMGSKLIVGDNTTIAPNVFLSNLEHEYSDTTKSVMDQGYNLKDTVIGEGCFIGYGAAILAGTVLGKHCIVGANAVVKGLFPDNCVIVGIPARIVKRFNSATNEWESVKKNGTVKALTCEI